MRKWAGFIAAVLLGACAPVSQADPATTAKTQSARQDEPMQNPTQTLKIYWLKKAGTPVFDSERTQTGSSRFWQKVTAYEEQDGWVKIHPHEDKWIKRTDLLETPPKTPLIDHQYQGGPQPVDPIK